MEQQKTPSHTGTDQGKTPSKDQHSTQKEHDKGQGKAGTKPTPSQHSTEKR